MKVANEFICPCRWTKILSLDKQSSELVCRPLECPKVENSSGQAASDFTFPYNGSCLRLGEECDINKYLNYTRPDAVPNCHSITT